MSLPVERLQNVHIKVGAKSRSLPIKRLIFSDGSIVCLVDNAKPIEWVELSGLRGGKMLVFVYNSIRFVPINGQVTINCVASDRLTGALMQNEETLAIVNVCLNK
nr:unknown [Darna trima granulovirus]